MESTLSGWLRRVWRQYVRPGLGLKRWLVLLFLGVVGTGIGADLLLRTLFEQALAPLALPSIPIPAWLVGGAAILVGLPLVLFGLWRFSRSFLQALLPAEATTSDRQLLRQVARRRTAKNGPHIVTIGGGTGMPTLLRGLRHYSDHITAIVTVADDGGSSGRLRSQLGLLPPGDFRNNMAALSEAEELMTQLLQYRFSASSGLESHSMGNLFIAAMAAITGSFESGIAESSRVLAVKGRVLPSTLEHVTLCAEVSLPRADGSQEWRFVRGESQIPKSGGRIIQVTLEPADARAYPDAVRAILGADLIVAGPGSFYTSVMPNLLVPTIREAVLAAKAPRLFVCNVANEAGETGGYEVDDYVRQLRRHAQDAFPLILANDNQQLPDSAPAPDWVALPQADANLPYRLFTADLVDAHNPARHDSTKLARAVMEIFETLQTTQPQPQGLAPKTAPSLTVFPTAVAQWFRSLRQAG